MAKVIITKALKNEILKTFKEKSEEIFQFLKTLETQPKKGKALNHVARTIIKELKFKKHRFYFITDGHRLKFGTKDELSALIIKFIKMSDKKSQQKTINEIKDTLKSFDLLN